MWSDFSRNVGARFDRRVGRRARLEPAPIWRPGEWNASVDRRVRAEAAVSARGVLRPLSCSAAGPAAPTRTSAPCGPPSPMSPWPRAAYSLTMRKGLPEPGRRQPARHGRPRGDARPVVPPAAERSRRRAGRPLVRRALRHAAFPRRAVARDPRRSPGEDIHLPIDVWGFPGGQTFLAGVPCLSSRGRAAIVSYLEPAMCRYFAPVIQATKARLMKLATPRDAEFGLRSAPDELSQPRPAAGPLRRRRRAG